MNEENEEVFICLINANTNICSSYLSASLIYFSVSGDPVLPKWIQIIFAKSFWCFAWWKSAQRSVEKLPKKSCQEFRGCPQRLKKNTSGL